MEPMPKPEVLDPDRVALRPVEGHDPDALRERLSAALRDACAYGDMLWNELARVRQYLAELADPAVDTAPRLATQAEWDSWAHVYTEVTSAMAGPTGDSGLALGEARQLAQQQGVDVLR